MTREILTLKKRASAEKSEAVSSTPVYLPRGKRVVVNKQPRPAKPLKPEAVSPPAQKKESKKAQVQQPAKEKKIIPPKLPKKRMPLHDAVETLCLFWPDLFPEGVLRPMAICTLEAMQKDIKLNALAISKKKVRRCLNAIGNSVEYRTTLIPGAIRYDKAGQPAGVVTEAEFENTLERIQRIQKQQARLTASCL